MSKNETALIDGKRLELVTRAELKLLREVRKLCKEEARATVVPPELLGHGWMMPRDAARLLGIGLSQVERLTHEGGDSHLPLVKGKIPTSEVLRTFKRIQCERLDLLAYPIRNLVRAGRSPTYWLDRNWGFGVEKVAETLGISKAAADRLMDEEGPLFAWAARRGGGPAYVTPEELSAYARSIGKTEGAEALSQ